MIVELHDQWTVHHARGGEYTGDGHMCWATREEAQTAVDGWPGIGAGYFVVRRSRPCYAYTCGCGRRLVNVCAESHFPTPTALYEAADHWGWARSEDGVLVCPDHSEES